jgi:hypothetical protein
MITLKITEREKKLLIRAVRECSFNIADSWCGTNTETGELDFVIPTDFQKDIDDLDIIELKLKVPQKIKL